MKKDKKPNYILAYQEKIKENLKHIKDNLFKKEYQAKIKQWVKKFNYDYNDFLEALKNNDYLLSFFIKEPSKQNIYEKVASCYIKTIKGITNFINLPNGGAKALYFDHQNIRKNSDYIGGRNFKSIDFQFNFLNSPYIFYCFHKYSNEKGGAQDNQYNEVKNAIINGSSTKINPNIQVIFICDGNYYTNDKILQLKQLSNNNNIHIIRIYELKNLLLSLNI